jgi:hypothetical protein
VSKNELIEVEGKLDGEIAGFPIWKLPVRCVLFAMHYTLYIFFASDSLKAATVAGRMSHLIPLLTNCPAEPTGASAVDAYSAYVDVDPQFQQLICAINYGHFSEVMPQVRRGYYSVSKLSETHFRLDHSSSKLADVEAKDVILSELAMSHIATSQPDVRSAIEQLASTVPHADLKLVASVLGTYIDHYLKNRVEPEFVPDSLLTEALGINNAELRRFTATLLAIANFAIDIARAVEMRVRKAGDDRDEVEAEWLEWVSIFWTEGYLRNILTGTSGISGEAFQRLLAIFSLDFCSVPPVTRHGREGYFPPLALLPTNAILIGPFFTLLFTHTRNLIYALQSLDQRKFDEIVSGGLEPQLLKEAEAMMRSWPGMEVKPNVVWAHGEIDLLAFEAATKTALQIQAKAAIAPYGARMVARLEDRVQEGMEQIRSFRDLPQEQRDSVISHALGRKVAGVKLVDIVLARSCFGSLRVWENSSDILLLSLAILAELTRRVGADHSLNASDIPALIDKYLNGVIAKANPVWSHKPLGIGAYVIDVPMLDFDQPFIDAERRRLWS